MKRIGLVKLRSALSASDEALQKEADAFLSSFNGDGEFSFVKASKNVPTVFFVMTGGSEIYFKDCYQKFTEPYVLLASGERNSLAASLEILSFLRAEGKQGQLVYGEPKQIAEKLAEYATCFEARKKIASSRLGVIGTPSDWLIASTVDKKKCKRKFGLELVNVPAEVTRLNGYEVPITVTDVQNTAELRSWTVTVNGVRRAAKVTYRDGKIMLLSGGTYIIVR